MRAGRSRSPAGSPALAVAGACVVGLAAGIPFATCVHGRRERLHAGARPPRSASSTARAPSRSSSADAARRRSRSPRRGRRGIRGRSRVLWALGALALPRAARELGRSPTTRLAIASRMISAASAASAGSASSAGWWLIPSLHGTKTIALGTRSATHIVSCAAPECISHERLAGRRRGRLERVDDAARRAASRASVWRCATLGASSPAARPRRPRTRRCARRRRWIGARRPGRGCRARSARRSAIALISPGSTSISPTVPTVPLPRLHARAARARAPSRRARASGRGASPSASRRRGRRGRARSTSACT